MAMEVTRTILSKNGQKRLIDDRYNLQTFKFRLIRALKSGRKCGNVHNMCVVKLQRRIAINKYLFCSFVYLTN